MNENNPPFEKQAKAKFEDSLETLDAATLSKITQIRHRAMDKAREKQANFFNKQNWFALSGIASACLAIIIFIVLPQQSDDIPAANKPITENHLLEQDIDLLSAMEELELYEELEFYEWLETYKPDDEKLG